MNIWFTSDLHFGHKNVIKYCDRPYEDVEHMDNSLIGYWQNTVREDDEIYILGDMFFTNAERAIEILEQLPGRKILVLGNHDRMIRNNVPAQKHFAEIHDLLERRFTIDKTHYHIVMCHYAMRTWNRSHHGALHLFGHSHGTMPDDGSRSMDVGVDANGMEFFTLQDIVNKLANREVKGFDHHA